MRPLLVDSQAKADFLLECLHAVDGPVGVDTETLGCNPEVESPIGRARVWSLQLAWGEPSSKPPSDFYTAFIPAECLQAFKPWLEDASKPKTGSSLFSYDRHVFNNEGINLAGVVGCTWLMSKLLNPAKEGHGLKDWGYRLGYEPKEFRSFSTRPSGLKVRAYKKDRVKDGITYIAGAEFQGVNYNKRVMIPLDELWRDYPERRAAIVEYAVMDPAMSLDTYHHLRGEMNR
jgi:DNA polymerase I-like protein with 3'-5' exonuclease and polymerase domains